MNVIIIHSNNLWKSIFRSNSSEFTLKTSSAVSTLRLYSPIPCFWKSTIPCIWNKTTGTWTGSAVCNLSLPLVCVIRYSLLYHYSIFDYYVIIDISLFSLWIRKIHIKGQYLSWAVKNAVISSFLLLNFIKGAMH